MMKNKKFSIEDIFRDTFMGHQQQPSDKVLRTLRRQLFISDFFSFNFSKLNVFYVVLITSGIISFPVLINYNKENPNVSEKSGYHQKHKSELAESEELRELSSSNEAETNEIQAMPETERGNISIASFGVNTLKGCVPLKIQFTNKSVNAETYSWDFGTGDRSLLANPDYVFKHPGVYEVKLVAVNSEGVKASYGQIIEVYHKPEAGFTIDIEKSDLNSLETAFNNTSTGAGKYKWNFGDNTYSEEETPKHVYKDYRVYDVSLIATSREGCSDTVTIKNKFIKKNYQLVFPSQFKPGIQGPNSGYYERSENQPFVFYPGNFGVKQYRLTISAQNGIEVFSTTNIKQGWNGYIRGRIAPAGYYNYTAEGIYPNGKEFAVKGIVKLVVPNHFDNH